MKARLTASLRSSITTRLCLVVLYLVPRPTAGFDFVHTDSLTTRSRVNVQCWSPKKTGQKTVYSTATVRAPTVFIYASAEHFAAPPFLTDDDGAVTRVGRRWLGLSETHLERVVRHGAWADMQFSCGKCILRELVKVLRRTKRCRAV